MVAWRSKTNTKHIPKGEKHNEGKVVNRLWVVNSQVEEKGRGKEKVPLDPIEKRAREKTKEKKGKRTRPGFLRNQFQDRARAREAKASVRVFFFRGGRGGGGDCRQLLSAVREGLCALGVVLPPLRPQPHRRKGVLLRLLQTTGRGSGRRYRVSGVASQGVWGSGMKDRMTLGRDADADGRILHDEFHREGGRL